MRDVRLVSFFLPNDSQAGRGKKADINAVGFFYAQGDALFTV